MAHETVIKHGLITNTLNAAGAIKFGNYINGSINVDASGNLTVDTNTYLTTTAANAYQLKATTLAGYGITDAYTKNEVDGLITGITWKAAVKCATTTNISLAGTTTIDGYAVQVGDRVLVKNQTTPSQNGIYVVAAGAWSRATDADSATEIDQATVFVERGGQANTQWTQTATVATVNTDTVTFAQIAGAGTYTNGNGITLIGNAFSVNTQMSITVDASGVKLVNDSAAPGNSMYYGTNGTGTKGWFAFVGITDGDKGDIVVSNSGSTWTIDSQAVTYSKIQNVSSTSRLLGRFSAGAGSIEEISLGSGISLSGGALTLDADLSAIATLAGTSGFLRKTAADTWTLDTNTYLTSETDTLNSVTGRGNTTTNAITVGSITLGTQAATVNSKQQVLAAGTTAVFSVAKTLFKGLYIDYVVYNGTNQRSGTVVVTTDGTSIDFSENTTNDLGNTGTIDVDAVINGANVDFRFISVPDATYTARVIYRYI